MPQFGADTIIGAQVRVLACDCFDTLVELDEADYRAREGIPKFLDHYARALGLPVVVVTDADEAMAEKVLVEAGLRGWFSRIYHRDNATFVDDKGIRIKDLRPVIADYAVAADEVCLIGDSRLDELAARYSRVQFVRVPGSIDRDFSFLRLIGGASQYRSGEYLDLLKDGTRTE